MSVKIFFSYAHEDEIFLKSLKKHLSPLQREGLIWLWHDRDISAGTEWDKEIDRHLNSAQIILLLVSPDFMNSDYCYGIELKRAVERHKNGEARVIPIILRHVDYEGALFNQLSALPTGAIPVTDRKWRNRDEAFFDIAQNIRKMIELLSKLSPFDQIEETVVPAISRRLLINNSNDLQGTKKFTSAEIKAAKESLHYDLAKDPTKVLHPPSVSTSPSLCIKQDNGLWQIHQIEGASSIGRDRDNDIQLKDIIASRKHAMIYFNDDGKCILEDIGSSNGTIVNGIILRKGDEHILEGGDQIQIGQTHLVFNPTP